MNKNPRKRQLKDLPISRLFPNMITLAGLCCGLSAIRFAMLERWDVSVIFILIAAVLDGMDGRIARFLNSTSTFGAQLDSLSDFLSFGVAPALVLHLWMLHVIKGFGWMLVLFYAVCCALRLARFNTSLLEDEKQPWQHKFFTGVPSPAGAILAIAPLILSFEFSEGPHLNPLFVSAYLALIAVLMASRIPTYSMKGLRVSHEWVTAVMLWFGITLALMVIEPWKTLVGICAIYLLTIPISALHYFWHRRKQAAT